MDEERVPVIRAFDDGEIFDPPTPWRRLDLEGGGADLYDSSGRLFMRVTSRATRIADALMDASPRPLPVSATPRNPVIDVLLKLVLGVLDDEWFDCPECRMALDYGNNAVRHRVAVQYHGDALVDGGPEMTVECPRHAELHSAVDYDHEVFIRYSERRQLRRKVLEALGVANKYPS
jgi:hypothetical protein